MPTDLSILRNFRFVVTPGHLALTGTGAEAAIGGGGGNGGGGGGNGGAGAGTTLSGGALTVLNRNRNRNRNLNRNRNRTTAVAADPSFLQEPFAERKLLYERIDDWIDLPLAPPAALAQLRRECVELLRKQYLLSQPEQATRREEILLERSLELSRFLRPLNIEEAGGYGATETLMLKTMLLTDEIGLHYKNRFRAPRPNQVEPRLRPFIANPPHNSYPSNHSFQSFSVAFVFARVLPEHSAVCEIFDRARRIAENREWAGVHYPSDTRAGYELARMVLPVLETVLRQPMLDAQDEWI